LDGVSEVDAHAVVFDNARRLFDFAERVREPVA
jgi:hypothetical protein